MKEIPPSSYHSIGPRAPALTLTQRDREILWALVHCVKVFSVFDIAGMWWGNFKAVPLARRRLRKLERAGLVELRQLVVHQMYLMFLPIVAWKPGQAVPDLDEVAEIASQRWPGSLRSTSVVVATGLAAAKFGGIARAPRLSEGTHDLYVGYLYLQFRRSRPNDAKSWESEAILARRGISGEKIPDAMIRSRTAIEVCGSSYTSSKIRAFHDYCADQQFGYELW